MRSLQFENKSVTPDSQEETSAGTEQRTETLEEFFARGGTVKKIPAGESAMDPELSKRKIHQCGGGRNFVKTAKVKY